jgi:hypothetical protein
MRHNEDYWERYNEMKWKYSYLLKNWQALLVKEVDQERQIMDRDKLIITLQNRIKDLTH